MPSAGAHVAASVEAVAVVVLRELVGFAVKLEASLVDSVCIASDGGAEVSAVCLGIVSLYAVEAEDNVGHFSFAVGYHKGYHAATEVCDACFHAVGVLEHEKCCGVASVFVNEFLGIET